MAVSKQAEKERLAKERESKLKKELLDKEMKSKSLQERIARATGGGWDGPKYYPAKKTTPQEKRQIGSEIIQSQNRKTGTATENMKKDKSTMGYNATPKTGLRGFAASIKSGLSVLPNITDTRSYDRVRGEGAANKANLQRETARYKIMNDFTLKNKWENPNYGAEKKKKKGMK